MNLSIYIPRNRYHIRAGYYNTTRLCRLLRRIARRPRAVLFVADMLE